MDAIGICLKIPTLGDNEPPGYRVGPAIGVVAYDASVGAWMPDRRATAALPAIAHRAWHGRAAAIDGLRRILLAPPVYGLLAMRVRSAANADDASVARPGFVRARLRTLARATRRKPAETAL